MLSLLLAQDMQPEEFKDSELIDINEESGVINRRKRPPRKKSGQKLHIRRTQ